MWDFTQVIWKTSAVMRYDTPGDWYGDIIAAWEGLPLLSQRAVQLHEFIEAVILRATGITEEMIDIIDNFQAAAGLYAAGEIGQDELAQRALSYRKLPPEIHNLYEQAHVIALLAERAFLEAGGGNWQEHDRLIEDSRGQIPVE